MQQNISDAVKYLEENSKLLPEWFQPNHMMINFDTWHWYEEHYCWELFFHQKP